MKSKTHIIVLHMKEIIYTAIFLAFAVILILLLIFMFGGKKKEKTPESAAAASADSVQADPDGLYIPGVYTSSIILGENCVDIAVTVDSSHINSVALVNLEESTATMFPLLDTCVQDIRTQLAEGTPLENITGNSSNQYTIQILTGAIEKALTKARR